MGRSSVRERVQKEPEPLPRLFFAQPQRFEHARLHVLAMNSYASRAQFDAIQHQVVALRPALPGRGFQLVQVFLEDPREWMLRADPALVTFTPLKKREAGNPREFPFGAIKQMELVAQVQADLARDTQRSIRVRDLFLRGHSNNQ